MSLIFGHDPSIIADMVHFTKMHGAGNDFILIDGIANPINEEHIKKLATSLCDRHTGVGADGVMLVLPSNTADLKMRIFNADSSEAEMCGNGIRCFALYAWEQKYVKTQSFSVETAAGIMRLEIIETKPGSAQIKIDMGVPFFKAKDIPVKIDGTEPFQNIPILVNGQEYVFTPVGMGNPHAVFFIDSTSNAPVTTAGPFIETHPFFPNRTNVEFIQVLSPSEINMRVWERGSGETLACGTGACASVVAGITLGKLADSVTVHLLGGDLYIEWKSHSHVFMTGPAEIVFKGELSL